MELAVGAIQRASIAMSSSDSADKGRVMDDTNQVPERSRANGDQTAARDALSTWKVLAGLSCLATTIGTLAWMSLDLRAQPEATHGGGHSQQAESVDDLGERFGHTLHSGEWEESTEGGTDSASWLDDVAVHQLAPSTTGARSTTGT